MTMVNQERERIIERQKHMMWRKIKRVMRKHYSDYCVISTKDLFEETVLWLESMGFRVFPMGENA